jgi:hypothetical protein
MTDQNKSPPLLPCHFCGGAAQFDGHRFQMDTMHGLTLPLPPAVPFLPPVLMHCPGLQRCG